MVELTLKLTRLAATVVALLLCASASAEPVEWILRSVSLADGETLAGSFIYDADAGENGRVLTASVRNSGTIEHPAAVWDTQISDVKHPGNGIALTSGPAHHTNRVLQLKWGSVNLTNSGGRVALSTRDFVLGWLCEDSSGNTLPSCDPAYDYGPGSQMVGIRGGELSGAPSPPAFGLTFPLPNLTAGLATINAVLDHSGAFFRKDGVVAAFTGEVASCDYGIRKYDLSTGLVSILTEKKRRAVCAELKAGTAQKGFLYEYLKADLGAAQFPPNDTWFSYDGHSGYDFQSSDELPILAAEAGVLCVATPETAARKPIHRDPIKCPYAGDPINGQLGRTSPWNAFHTFYIVHGTSENYTTWYLHASNLDPIVASAVATNGYATVERGQVIAAVGGCCIGLGPHLHFEVRKGDDVSVDPYGWQGSPRLWE